MTHFPYECGEWASEGGCTRITTRKDNCTRPEDIPNTYDIVYMGGKPNTTQSLAATLVDCLFTVGVKSIIYPDVEDIYAYDFYMHVAVTSTFWGFIDDLYIKASTYDPMRRTVTIQMQSQLRLGKYDFNKNYEHVSNMYQCLTKELKVTQPGYPPIKACS